MAIVDNLVQFAKLEKDEVQRGVYETIITHDALMPFLKFRSFEGNAYSYNRELTLPTASPVATVGSTFQTTRGTKENKTASLTLVYVQSDQDLYVAETRGSIQDPNSIVLSDMTKALTRKLSDLFIHGDSAVDGVEFDGLDRLARAETRMMAMDDGNIDGPGTAETELTLPRLDELIDNIDDGRTKPAALIMNTTIRRKLTDLARASGSGVLIGSKEMFGQQVMTYADVPIIINNFITDAETYADTGTWSSSTASTIFAVKFGEPDQGFTLLHNGPVFQPKMLDLGVPLDEHTNVWRMYAYVQGIIYAPKQMLALGGIDSTA